MMMLRLPMSHAIAVSDDERAVYAYLRAARII